jgi:[acyl-carrier-protein] S-malonyltransferase
MTKTAWVFPGQGSQAVGMGSDLYDLPAAQTKFEQAKQILGWSVPEVCQSTDDKVSKTLYTQPCLYVIESILADLMRERERLPDLVAGHSLGEYVALYAVGVFDFESGLRLVQRRAALMDAASEGVMAALLGVDRDQLEQQLSQTPDVVLANDNNAAQVVISGKPEAVESIMSTVKAKRAVKLNVSGAFHSPLMADASADFQKDLNAITFHAAQVPVLSNVEPTPVTEGMILKERLIQQMTGSVRWRETCLKFLEAGIDRVIEIGPGKVLTGITKRTCPNLTLENVSSLADLPE